MDKNTKKYFLVAYVTVMVGLTIIYPLIMVCTAGAGLIYNGESYGRELESVGIWLIISGLAMTLGTIGTFFRKRIFRIISAIFTVVGLAVCLVMVYKVCSHADYAGWVDNFTMEPVSRMYRERLLPVIVPSVMSLFRLKIDVGSE